jgi:uncharacterized membrane protein YkvA (DUF1232 family)
MTDVLGREIKTRIEEYLASPLLHSKASDPQVLKKIETDFLKKSLGLRLKLGDVFADLETFYQMLFDPDFTPDEKTRTALVAVMIYFLNPFDFIPGGIPIVGLVDDRLVIAFAAQVCRPEIDRFTTMKQNPD